MDARARRGLQLVSTVVRTFSQQTANYEELLPAIAKAIVESIPSCCMLSLFSEDRATVSLVAIYDEDPAVVEQLASYRKTYSLSTSSLAADVIANGTVFQPTVDVDALHQRSPGLVDVVRKVRATGFMVVPMRAGGELVGIITLLRRGEPLLDNLDLQIVEDIAAHAALAISNSRLGEQRLRQTTMFLDTIVENIPDMIFVKDADRLAFVRLNRAGEQLLGVSRADLVGKNDYDFFPASEADFFTQKDRETLRDKQLVDIPEEPIRTATGTRWLHTKKVPLVDEHGVPRYLLGISHDITERKRAEAQLRAAKETVEHANRELESFAYSIAHDLRSPLRGILGYASAVIEDAGDLLPEQARRYVSAMHAAAQRMSTLIEELLGLARVTQAELVRSRVDLSALVHSVIGGHQTIDKDRHVEVIIEPNLVVDADPHLIATVITNLVDNAWKFTARRDRARIEVGRTNDAFFVRDNGAGFDMAYADQLFGVFRRLHMQEEFPGTGIGLATVARIIHRHHGRVWAESKPGEGATFYFTLGESL